MQKPWFSKTRIFTVTLTHTLHSLQNCFILFCFVFIISWLYYFLSLFYYFLFRKGVGWGLVLKKIPLQFLTVSISVALSYLQPKAGAAVRNKLCIYLSDIIDICIIYINSVPSPWRKYERSDKPPYSLVARQLHLWRLSDWLVFNSLCFYLAMCHIFTYKSCFRICFLVKLLYRSEKHARKQ